MQFSFGVVEAALAHVHTIREDARSAFSARLKHFQRLGFPPGINTGRGRAASYDIGHLLLLMLALELVQLGIPPERAKEHVEGEVKPYARMMRLLVMRKLTNDAQPQYGVGFYASGLLPLMTAHFAEIEAILLFGPLEDFARVMGSERAELLPRFSHSNLTVIYARLAPHLATLLGVDESAVDDAVVAWTGRVAAEEQHGDD